MKKFFFRAGNVSGRKPKELQRMFRNLFLTSEGLEVLRILLSDWCFFDACRTDQDHAIQDRAMNEYAKYFLSERLGLVGISVYTELAPDFVDKLEQEEG